MLGEFLEQNCPDVTVQVVIKSNEDWGEYIDSVSSKIFEFLMAPGYLICGFFDRYVEHMDSTNDPALSSTRLRVSALATALSSRSTSETTTIGPLCRSTMCSNKTVLKRT